MTTPAELWRAAVALDPSRPFVTCYDDTGGRVELSFATFDNWVAKTANLLVDGLGADEGDRVVLALPLHWQSLVWLLACWSTGTVALPLASGTSRIPDADFVASSPEYLDAALDTGAREVVGLSLHPLGMPLEQRPAQVVDYATEVRAYGDHFTALAAPRPDLPALESDRPRSGGELAALAEERATAWELSPSDRIAVVTSPGQPTLLNDLDLSWFLACLAGPSAVVIMSDTDSASLLSRLRKERVTAAVLGARSADALGDGGRIRPLVPLAS